MSEEAATSAAVFCAYLDQAAFPERRHTKPAGAVLVVDSLPVHKAPRVRVLLDRSNVAYRYLPAPTRPNSP